MKMEHCIDFPDLYEAAYRCVVDVHHAQIVLWYIKGVHDPTKYHQSEWHFYTLNGATREEILRTIRAVIH